MISFRMGILKAMRKMTEKGKEMCVCFCVCRVVGALCFFFPGNVGVISLIVYR